ncbi:MAG: HEPN domain-containing protein [Bacteroidetes bacterium]|nr:MAG: HEPN domain-containing protein [Bacteroidota bacterium]
MLKSDEPITDSICFHSQQAAEKFLKLYLVYKGIEPEKTHNISDLLYKCKLLSEEF